MEAMKLTLKLRSDKVMYDTEATGATGMASFTIQLTFRVC